MKTLYVVTHPEATHHVDKLVGGWFDSELTDHGQQQARRIAARIRELVPTNATAELISSDLRRTTQTAEAIAATLAVEPTYTHGLREKSYGIAGGRPQSWLDARFVPPPAVGDRMNHHEGIEGAETKREIASRVYAAIAEIVSRPATNQVIVTHGGTLTFVINAWIGLPLDAASYAAFRATSGGISVLREDDFFHNRTVVTLNDTAHLENDQR